MLFESLYSEGVRAYRSFFPGRSRLREQGKNGIPGKIPWDFSESASPKIKQARLAADAPAFRVSRKKEWRGRSMKKFKLCCFLNSSSLRKEGSVFL